jgi:hypothetical protein
VVAGAAAAPDAPEDAGGFLAEPISQVASTTATTTDPMTTAIAAPAGPPTERRWAS